jgi:hypothetical protein
LNLYDEVHEKSLIQNASYSSDNIHGEKHFNAMLIVANTMLNLDEFLMKN